MNKGCANMNLSYNYLFNYEVGFSIISGLSIISYSMLAFVWYSKKKESLKLVEIT